ncbi:MAG: ABC transporter ATP-binding protein [Rhodospirillaceae bacterium]|nr:ABC transporter ATP-binding protein [Rhodospirillaceae bacterium]
MLSVEGLKSGYGKIEALRGLDLEVGEGEIVTLIGANGAGKTTLLMTICGNPRATAGVVSFDGTAIDQMPTHEIIRLGIAHAPEGRRIFARMTVLENLQLGTPGIDAPTERFEQVYDLFPILKERGDQRGGTLSGGEQQMLAIGRALMAAPKLLLLDEPSLGLAPLMVKRIFEAIGEINRNHGTTILLVEQNAHQALRLADRGYVLVNGKITLAGPSDDLLANQEVRKAYLEGGH